MILLILDKIYSQNLKLTETMKNKKMKTKTFILQFEGKNFDKETCIKPLLYWEWKLKTLKKKTKMTLIPYFLGDCPIIEKGDEIGKG